MVTPGKGRFEVQVAGGQRMEVFYYLPQPDRFDPVTTPVVFMLHGARRDADRYFEQAMATGAVERLGLLLLVPRFSEELFPKRSGYNFGNWFKQDCVRWLEGHRSLPKARPVEETAFAALEAVFDAARAATGSRAASYTLFGHSAGAQFAHRCALLYGLAAAGAGAEAGGTAPAFRASRIVCANAGWYTMPTFTGGPFEPSKVFPFPYGLDLLSAEALPSSAPSAAAGATPETFARAFLRQPLLLLLGEQDTDPALPSPELWHSSPGSDAQGAHRLERGHSFFEAGRAAAAALGVDFGWDLKTAPGVGHEGGRMLAVALRLLFDPAAGGQVDLERP